MAKLGETEAQRQKEKKEVEERDDAKKVTKSPGSVSGRNKLTKDKNLVVVSILVSWYSTIPTTQVMSTY